MLAIPAFIAISAFVRAPAASDLPRRADSFRGQVSAASAAGPAIVNLGSAADFVILAERGISTDPTSDISASTAGSPRARMLTRCAFAAGNIGVTPQGASYLTGFSLDHGALDFIILRQED